MELRRWREDNKSEPDEEYNNFPINYHSTTGKK